MRLFTLLASIFLFAFPAAASETYRIDPIHSEVSFHIRHLGLAKVYGRFVNYEGTIVADDADVSKSTVDVTIEASSINTENAMRDKDLRSANFFDVAKFPTLTFKSVSVKGSVKGTFEVTGDLTIHGVTHRITLPMSATGTLSNPKETRAGFEGSITLNRSDYGISYLPAVVGEEVSITLSIEAIRTDAKS